MNGYVYFMASKAAVAHRRDVEEAARRRIADGRTGGVRRRRFSLLGRPRG